jgi:hypothetical protein
VIGYSRDANKLVLKPLEKIFNKLRDTAANPIMVLAVQKTAKDEKPKDEDMYETKVLDETFTKVNIACIPTPSVCSGYPGVMSDF